MVSSIAEIQALVRQGFTDWQQYGRVTVKSHSIYPYLIFNYTEAAQFEGEWTYLERVSRGLIIHATSGEIIARPFDKFFNWGEHGLATDAPITGVYEKVDGSLGILYPTPSGHYAVATRGSFDGEQALWATQFLRETYHLGDLSNDVTLLFEIIYPGNRIVVDYGDLSDLVLLAARNKKTGLYANEKALKSLAYHYGFSLPENYSWKLRTVYDLVVSCRDLDANQEGYVVHFEDGQIFKFKGDRYRELHRLISNLSFKNTLAAVAENRVSTILDTLPDEFHAPVKAWLEHITSEVSRLTGECDAAFAAAPKSSRKDFAVWVQQNHTDLQSYLFAMLDGRDIHPLIYRKHNWDTSVDVPF